jgi:dTDP-4-amino-4,6-dideoxygalactose transaminase
MIPFSPPRVDQKIIDEVVAALKSGWITTGPRTKLLETKIAQYTGAPAALCLNSATAGLELMLRWYGVGPGDEVILPAYTYAATANVIMHCGATPVFVDVNRNDFNISLDAIEKNITARTKVIMPVDFAGLPCDYEQINGIVMAKKHLFVAATDNQRALGRVLVLADAAHSLGGKYLGRQAGSLTDASVFSFHAVKNLSTAEGGAVALNLPAPFDNHAEYQKLCVKSLHGQNKDALAKMQKGNWKYDIVEDGYKCNMTDIAAAMGLVELERYEADTLVKRRHICNTYRAFFERQSHFELPVQKTAEKESSYHVFALRVAGITEEQRDAIIQKIFDKDVSVNVHFKPVPMMSFYKSRGYDIRNYPQAYDNFSREISLPVYYDLTDRELDIICQAVLASVHEVLQ